MRHAPLAAALVASAVALVADLRRPSSPVPSADAGNGRTSVRRCVKYGQTLAADRERVTIALTSRCDFRVSCELAWAVRCDGGATGGEASFTLDRGDVGEAIASAAACHGDWEIADVRWSCSRTDAATP